MKIRGDFFGFGFEFIKLPRPRYENDLRKSSEFFGLGNDSIIQTRSTQAAASYDYHWFFKREAELFFELFPFGRAIFFEIFENWNADILRFFGWIIVKFERRTSGDFAGKF